MNTCMRRIKYLMRCFFGLVYTMDDLKVVSFRSGISHKQYNKGLIYFIPSEYSPSNLCQVSERGFLFL